MSDPFLKSLRADFTKRALWEITKWGFIGLVLLVWTYVGSNTLTTQIGVLTPYKWPLLISAIAIVTLGTGQLYRRFSRSYPRFGKLDFQFELLHKEIHYVRKEDGSVLYTKRIRLRALTNQLDTYRDKYHWTGELGSAPEATIKGQHLYQTVRKNVWQFYEVQLGKTLNRGAEAEVEVRWNLNDASRKAVPFISATIEEPTKKLTLHVALPRSLGITKISREVSSSIGAPKPISSEELDLSRDGEISQTFDSPLLFHHYELKWIY